MNSHTEILQDARDIDTLHEIGSRIASADSFSTILQRVLDVVTDVVRCDSCFVYVRQDDQLILRASKNPHPDLVNRLGVTVGQGITGWVAEHCETVAIPAHAAVDPRFKIFHDLPEDSFEAFLSVPILCRGRVVGVINLQHRQPHHHTKREIRLVSTIGFLVGAELELARMETEKAQIARQLEDRKIMERAKGILQRHMNLSEEEAYLTLKKYSRQKRKSVREIAEAILLTDELNKTSR
jgi:signal transduction protein with GAF and PtsI domain